MRKMSGKIRSAALYSSQGQSPFQEDWIASDEEAGVVTLADGFGGIQGGEAARKICESIKEFLLKKSEDLESTLPFEIRKSYSLMENVVFNAFSYANIEVRKLNENRHIFDRGGASAVGAILYDGRLTLGCVGNISAWLVRSDWHPLVSPRSFERRMGIFRGSDSGRVLRSIPRGVLGLEEDFPLQLVELEPLPGDWLLIHSAGMRDDVLEELGQLNRRKFDEKDLLEWVQKICKSVQFTSNASLYLGIFD